MSRAVVARREETESELGGKVQSVVGRRRGRYAG